jgi:two-component system response regulator MprA
MLARTSLKPFNGIFIMKAKILLADDDASVREMLGRVLESEDYAVVLAKTGREAATKFAVALPDLVLLDLSMPDKNGWEAFMLMEQSRPFVPVIMITAWPQQYQQAAGLGIDALMEKPLDLPLLFATIAGLLAESETDRVQRLTNPRFKTFYFNRLAQA